MILKIIGSIMVISASVFIGYYMSGDCSQRPVQLRVLQDMLRMLENEIKFFSTYIPDAFEKICSSIDNPVREFFVSTAEKLKKEPGINASLAWEKAIRDNMCKTALNEEDRDILLSFGKMLGNSDAEGQMKNIGYMLQQLKMQEKKAEEDKRKNENLYRILGILGGITVVLFLI